MDFGAKEKFERLGFVEKAIYNVFLDIIGIRYERKGISSTSAVEFYSRVPEIRLINVNIYETLLFDGKIIKNAGIKLIDAIHTHIEEDEGYSGYRDIDWEVEDEDVPDWMVEMATTKHLR